MNNMFKIDTKELSYWFRGLFIFQVLHRYNNKIDAWTNEALKNPKFNGLTKYTVVLNGHPFWIANGYYGLSDSGVKMRPSRKNMVKFFDKLEEYRYNEDMRGI